MTKISYFQILARPKNKQMTTSGYYIQQREISMGNIGQVYSIRPSVDSVMIADQTHLMRTSRNTTTRQLLMASFSRATG